MGKRKTVTQNDLVLDYLEKHVEGITPQDSYMKLGVYRLSAIIFNLREMGYLITTINESAVNRYGTKCTYARYRLVKGVK